MGMRYPIDQIGMLVIGCSVALDDKWMLLFIMLACWLLDVMLAMMVIECPIDIGGFWTFLTSINKKPVKNKTLRQNS
jgi:ABC-type protease/lipase transport system fused ATPase/permease subunit